MAIKKPLCNYNGDIKELQAGDVIVQAATTVTTANFGDAGNVGTMESFAREDHKHKMPSSTGGISQAEAIALSIVLG